MGIMRKNETIFRLKTGKKRGTYTLKTGVGKKDGALQNISYRPGTASIFDIDNEKSVARAKPVTLKYNNHQNDPAVQITVPNADRLLIAFLMNHQKYNIDYEIYDEDVVAARKVQNYDDVGKALGYVNLSEEYEIKAAALAVFGMNYFGKSAIVCKQDLKAAAIERPMLVNNTYENPSFANKYIASLMYCHGIIQNNPMHTAVVWTENEGVIVHITQGESGLEKLTEYLQRKSEDSQSLLQEFGRRVEQVSTPKLTTEGLSKELSEKDKEIEELKAQLAKNAMASEKVADVPANETEIEKARREHFDKFKTEVPMRFKNDLEWIKNKLTQE